MEKAGFITVAGCVLKEKKTGLPDYSTLFCPECKKPLSSDGNVYFCPLCRYSTSKDETDGAIARSKARYGIR